MNVLIVLVLVMVVIFFTTGPKSSCGVDNLSQSILKGLACDKVETELEVMSFFPELSCACY